VLSRCLRRLRASYRRLPDVRAPEALTHDTRRGSKGRSARPTRTPTNTCSRFFAARRLTQEMEYCALRSELPEEHHERAAVPAHRNGQVVARFRRHTAACRRRSRELLGELLVLGALRCNDALLV